MTDKEMRSKFFEVTGKFSSYHSGEYRAFCLGAAMEREACALICEVDHPNTFAEYLGKYIRERSNV